jgi:hypothetical protein
MERSLCNFDPLRRLAIWIGHFVGEYLRINEPVPGATTAGHPACGAKRVIPKNVFGQNEQECFSLLFRHGLQWPVPVGALSGKLIDKGDDVVRMKNASFCQVELDAYR